MGWFAAGDFAEAFAGGGVMDPMRRCPDCGWDVIEWISTTNEWEYYCRRCDVRFNDRGQVQDPVTHGPRRVR